MKRIFPLVFLLGASSAADAQLMDRALQSRLERALPKLASAAADNALHGRAPGRRLFYTGDEIEHASQDGAGNRVGFYLSAHNRSANKDGKAGTDFEFPWKNPGGTDEGNVYAWKVMFLPGDTKVRVHRTTLQSFFGGANGNVFYGRGGRVDGYGWTFPDGTRFYELLSFSDRLSVFEVRTRHKDGGKWRVNVYRPFVTRDEFAEVVQDLPTVSRVKPWTLTDDGQHRSKTAFREQVKIEEIPGLNTTTEVDMLLRSRTFASALNRDWSEDSGPVPWTRSTTSIVPANYNGAFVGNSTASCQKCHADAGTHVRFFDAQREWYGFVRGEPTERILSFHPVDPSAISRNGAHRDMELNKTLLAAGLIEGVGLNDGQYPGVSPVVNQRRRQPNR